MTTIASLILSDEIHHGISPRVPKRTICDVGVVRCLWVHWEGLFVANAGDGQGRSSSIAIEPHFPALKLSLPELFDGYYIVLSSGGSADLEDTDLIIAWFAAPQAEIPTMTVLRVVEPASKKPIGSSRRADVLLLRS